MLGTHELIADIVALLPNAPTVPQDWPDIRFDIVWVLDAAGRGGGSRKSRKCCSPGIAAIRSRKKHHGRFSSVTRNGSSVSITSGDCV